MKILLFILFLSPLYGYSQSRCVDYFLKDAKNSPYRLLQNSHDPIPLFRFEDFLFDEAGISHLNDLMKHPEQPSLILNELLLDFRLRIEQRYSTGRAEVTDVTGERLDSNTVDYIQGLMKLVNTLTLKIVSEQTVNYNLYVRLMDMYMQVHEEVHILSKRKILNNESEFKKYTLSDGLVFRSKLQKKLDKIQILPEEISLEILADTPEHFPLGIPIDYFHFSTLALDFLGQGVLDKPFLFFDGLIQPASELARHDRGDHNVDLVEFFKKAHPVVKEKYIEIAAFLRTIRKSLTTEQRILIGALYFEYTHEQGLYERYIEELYRGKREREITHAAIIISATTLLIDDKSIVANKYSEEILRLKIEELANKISQDFKSRLYNPQ